MDAGGAASASQPGSGALATWLLVFHLGAEFLKLKMRCMAWFFLPSMRQASPLALFSSSSAVTHASSWVARPPVGWVTTVCGADPLVRASRPLVLGPSSQCPVTPATHTVTGLCMLAHMCPPCCVCMSTAGKGPAATRAGTSGSKVGSKIPTPKGGLSKSSSRTYTKR